MMFALRSDMARGKVLLTVSRGRNKGVSGSQVLRLPPGLMKQSWESNRRSGWGASTLRMAPTDWARCATCARAALMTSVREAIVSLSSSPLFRSGMPQIVLTPLRCTDRLGELLPDEEEQEDEEGGEGNDGSMGIIINS